MKGIAYILTLTILLSLLPILPASVGAQEGANDNILFLQKIGIMEKDVNPKSEVTRGEFAKAVSKVIKAPQSDFSFTDISTMHPFYLSAASLASIGYMKPNKNGAFLPDLSIDKKSAAVVLAKILGYHNMGYADETLFTIAVQQGILRGVSDYAEPLKQETLAIMLKNTLEAPLNKLVSVGSKQHYTLYKNVTLLTEYHNIYKGRGLFKSAYFTAIDPADVVNKNLSKIGDSIFAAEYEKFEKFVGYQVEYYYLSDKNTNDNDLIFVSALNTNDTEEISLSDIYDIEVSGLNYIIKYGDNQTIKMSRLANVIYNNECYADFNIMSLINAKNGSATFINNGTGSDFNVLKVNIYQSKIVDSANEELGKIITKNSGTTINVPVDDADAIVHIVDKDGLKLKLSNFQPWYVITMLQSPNGRYTKIIVTNDKVSGTITESSLSGDDSYFDIEGTKYPVHTEGYFGSTELSDLSSGVFLLNSFGDIVGMNTMLEVKKYGYLTKAGNPVGLKADYILRIFTDDGKFENFVLSKKCKVNGVPTTAEAALKNPPLYTNGAIKPQLILYELNYKKMEINSISTATDKSATPNYIGYDTSEFTKDHVTANPGYYRGGSKMLDNRYILTGRTKIFVIPTSADSESDYVLQSINNYKGDITGLLNWQVFDSNEFKECSAIVVPGDSKNYDKDLLIISKVKQVVDENGETVTKVDGFMAGKAVSLPLSDTASATSLQTGDVVRVMIISGKISTILHMFKAENYKNDAAPTDYLGGGAAWWSELVTVAGAINKKSSNAFTLKINNVESPLAYAINDGTMIYRYEKIGSTSRLAKGSISDVFETTRVFVHRKNDVAEFLIILPD